MKKFTVLFVLLWISICCALNEDCSIAVNAVGMIAVFVITAISIKESLEYERIYPNDYN